jgi:hypothetical protein
MYVLACIHRVSSVVDSSCASPVHVIKFGPSSSIRFDRSEKPLSADRPSPILDLLHPPTSPIVVASQYISSVISCPITGTDPRTLMEYWDHPRVKRYEVLVYLLKSAFTMCASFYHRFEHRLGTFPLKLLRVTDTRLEPGLRIEIAQEWATLANRGNNDS